MVDDRASTEAIDGAYYGRRLLKPERRTIADAWVVAYGQQDVKEAWERLAARGAIATEWLEHGPAVAQPDLSVACQPTSSEEVIAFASDAAGVSSCIQLAQELARALSAWNVCEPSAQIQWIVRPRQEWSPRHLHPMVLLHATTSMRRASLFDRVRLDFVAAASSCPSVAMVADTVRYAALWRATAMFGREQPSYGAQLAPPGFERRPFELWPDPWGAWLEILALGYAVDCFERTRITLVAPQYTGGAPSELVTRKSRALVSG
jgi:hypothetical protein